MKKGISVQKLVIMGVLVASRREVERTGQFRFVTENTDGQTVVYLETGLRSLGGNICAVQLHVHQVGELLGRCAARGKDSAQHKGEQEAKAKHSIFHIIV